MKSVVAKGDLLPDDMVIKVRRAVS